MPDIIDFQARKDRRVDAEIKNDQDRWEGIRGQLADIMVTSELSDNALVSASLRAMLDTLELDPVEPNMPRSEAKALVARCLKAFRE